MNFLDHFPPRSSTFSDALDNSRASIEIALLSWKMRFDYGVDHDNSCCQLLWLFVSLGPLHFSLALGH